jgi:exonuclease III
MIMLSLNIRGVGGPLKLASMRRLLSTVSPHIIFLQETLTTDVKARDFMFTLKPDWLACVVSAIGHSGGMLVSWDPRFFLSPRSLRVEEFF